MFNVALLTLRGGSESRRQTINRYLTAAAAAAAAAALGVLGGVFAVIGGGLQELSRLLRAQFDGLPRVLGEEEPQ